MLKSIGAQELTKKIWVPDAVLGSRKGLLTALEAGDTVFVNAYLIGTTAFAGGGKATEARYTAEFMGVEAVHRALARQSLGKLGNDLAFSQYKFTEITEAVTMLEAGGFGFGKKGSKKGRFYDFDAGEGPHPEPARGQEPHAQVGRQPGPSAAAASARVRSRSRWPARPPPCARAGPGRAPTAVIRRCARGGSAAPGARGPLVRSEESGTRA